VSSEQATGLRIPCARFKFLTRGCKATDAKPKAAGHILDVLGLAAATGQHPPPPPGTRPLREGHPPALATAAAMFLLAGPVAAQAVA